VEWRVKELGRRAEDLDESRARAEEFEREPHQEQRRIADASDLPPESAAPRAYRSARRVVARVDLVARHARGSIGAPKRRPQATKSASATSRKLNGVFAASPRETWKTIADA
jgi:hypothetical protein